MNAEWVFILLVLVAFVSIGWAYKNKKKKASGGTMPPKGTKSYDK